MAKDRSKNRHKPYTWRCLGCGELRSIKRKPNLKRPRFTGLCRSCSAKAAARVQHERAGRSTPEGRRRGDVRWADNQYGYAIAWWPEHPLASRRGFVMRSWAVYYDAHGQREWVVRAKAMGATMHHRNAKPDDDRPHNLELRWPGRHGQGWTTEAMIEVLQMQGYEVIAP